MLTGLWQDLRFGLRSLVKDRRFTLLAVLALALGIGSTTIVFSVFYNLLFNSIAAKDASRLAVPMGKGSEPLRCTLPDIDAIREQNQVFEDVVGYGRGIVIVSDGNETYQLYESRVTANAFDFYGVPPYLGRGITARDGVPGTPLVFVIGYETWKSDFNADPRIVGKAFMVSGEPRTLIGVMPPRFHAFGALVQVWRPFTETRDSAGSDRTQGGQILARLKPGVTLKTASADLNVIVKRLAQIHPDDFPKYPTVRVDSATDFLLGPYGIGGAGGSEIDLKEMLYDLLAAVMMLLLIACTNVANLLLARATIREKEIAIRSALGASRGEIIRQLLVESSVLAMAACALGCVLAFWGMKGATAIVPHKGISIGGEFVFGLDRAVLLFTLGITVLTTLVCGLVPAFYATRTDLQPMLTGNGNGMGGTLRHGKYRAALVITEVALSIILLTGAGLMCRSFYVLTHVELGFNPKNLLIAAFGSRGVPKNAEKQKVFLDTVLEKLKTLPGVANAAVNYTLPGYNGGGGSEITVPGSTHSEEGGFEVCGESLFQTLGLQLLRGKWFSDYQEGSAPHVAVINETLARNFFGHADPVGRRIEARPIHSEAQSIPAVSYDVIGVVADVKNYNGPKQPVRPMGYTPYSVPNGFVILIKTSVAPRSLMRAIQQQIWEIDSSVTFGQFEPLEETFDRLTYSAPEFGLAAIAPLAGVCLLLVVIGVFSVMAYTVSLQTREIGIRMALGAQQKDIMGMVLKKGLGLIVMGTVIGLLATFNLTRFLASQIWGIPANDPWTIGFVVTLIMAVGLAACWLPARRAARVDPLVALRYQ